MAELLSVSGILVPGDSRTHRSYPFRPSGDGSALRIRFSYEPKYLDDPEKAEGIAAAARRRYGLGPEEPLEGRIANLVTLSVDDGAGFRGCAHRGAPEQVIRIGPEGATEGFAPGPIVPGDWSVVLSAHSIATGTCSFRLSVEEEA